MRSRVPPKAWPAAPRSCRSQAHPTMPAGAGSPESRPASSIADPGVGDGELDEAAAIAHFACRKLDLASLSELAGITEEIKQYLPQPHGVHGQCPEVLLGVNHEAVLVLLGQLSGGADDLVDQRS